MNRKAIAFVVQRVLGSRPVPYFFMRSLTGKWLHLVVNDKTELVIEGYPRSANSFAVIAFEQAQRNQVNIAHHLHVPAQVIRGVCRGIPTIVLLREPVAAITSLVVREPALGIGLALWDYIHFYRAISRYRDGFLIARFEEITSDFGTIIERVNRKWGTQFQRFTHTDDSVARAFARLDNLEPGKNSGKIDEDRVARPSDQRREKSGNVRERLLSPAYEKRLRKAEDLYRSLCETEAAADANTTVG